MKREEAKNEQDNIILDLCSEMTFPSLPVRIVYVVSSKKNYTKIKKKTTNNNTNNNARLVGTALHFLTFFPNRFDLK